MFRNTFQSGFLSILYAIGSKPLQIWRRNINNGYVKRITDFEMQSSVIEICGANVSTCFLSCPASEKQTLGIKMPFLVLLIKYLKKYFTFEVQVIDDKNVKRRFRASNYQSNTRVKPFICTIPMKLDEGWNQIHFNLTDFTRRAYGTNYLETLRVQIHANCRIRRIYFTDQLLSSKSIPAEYRAFNNAQDDNEEQQYMQQQYQQQQMEQYQQQQQNIIQGGGEEHQYVEQIEQGGNQGQGEEQGGQGEEQGGQGEEHGGQGEEQGGQGEEQGGQGEEQGGQGEEQAGQGEEQAGQGEEQAGQGEEHADNLPSQVDTSQMKFGGIEAGGTKFVVAIGDDQGHISNRESFPTTTPEETTEKIIEYFTRNPVDAIGLGCFGPIDPDKNSPTYGYITTTPKPGWANYDIVGAIKKGLNNIPVGFDTDVNAACLGEVKFGAAQGLDSALYLTIGTGLGGGAYVEGNLVHGLLHPEMGHMMLVRREDDTYEGHCPFHKGCLEGMAAGPGLGERWGVKGDELESDHKAWDLEAYYLGQACATYVLILSPKKIILGGGVMMRKQLFPLIHKYTQEFLNGYIQKDEILKDIENYIIPPGLGNDAGIVGSIALAVEAVKS